MARARRMALGSGDQIFGAIIDQSDRSARFPGEQSGVAGDYRRILFFAAETPSRHRLNHADFCSGQIEQFDQRLMDVVRALHRTPHRHSIIRIGDGDHSVIFDVELFLGSGFVFAFDDKIGLGPYVIDPSLLDHE
jgi:hypothetical protein